MDWPAPFPPLCRRHHHRRRARRHEGENKLGLSVSVDNLGENVTNAEEARHSAQLYHQMLDAMQAQGSNANVSLKLTHMGLDVDEAMAYEIASGWSSTLRGSTVLSALTWRARPTRSGRSTSCIACTASRRMPGTWARWSSRTCFAAKKMLRSSGGAHPHPAVQGRVQRGAGDRVPEEGRCRCELRQADEDTAEERRLSRIATHDENMIHATIEFAQRKRSRPPPLSFRCSMASAATCSKSW